MFRLIIFIALIYLLYKMIKTFHRLKSERNENLQSKSTTDRGEELVEDPVCHTYIPLSQAYKKTISGKDYYFCSKQCSDKYTIKK